jgi:threonyl-tRNA synthetase
MVDNLEKVRHTGAHILAQAVKELFPKVKLGMGPAIENGFYYDFDKEEGFSAKELKKIEKRMKEIVRRNIKLEKQNISKEKAKILFKGQKYKLELLKDLSEKTASLYKQGEFIDLCKGPHAKSTGEVKHFKILNTAGAYWKGTEKNKMLSRIYVACFKTEKELKDHLTNLEEAKKRDHTKLGKELDLFVISETVGKGLPLLTPKGATIKRILKRFIEDEEIKRGYQYTETPIMARSKLYKISGHLDHYKESMFVFKTNGEEMVLRPMTCPHQFMIYKSKLRSYRELPIKYAEIAELFRNEKSGELHGLLRVRQFSLADAHIICTPEQLEKEFEEVVRLIQFVMKTLGFTDYWYRFSKGDIKNKEKYIDNPKAWRDSEKMMKKIIDKMKLKYVEAKDEAAFYGPKLDIQMKNVHGKEDTIFTVQIDFALPERFDMTYEGKSGKKERPMIIHRSSIGALERTIAMLIEHYAGKFPLWLSPIQVKIMTLTDRSNKFAKEITKKLQENNIRVELDSRNLSIGKKVRDAQTEKINYMVTIGDKEMKDKQLAIRSRDGKVKFGVSPDKFIKDLLKQIQEKK